LVPRLNVAKDQKQSQALSVALMVLWLSLLLFPFGGIVLILNKLQFNPVSQFIITFFLAIVSFLAYRISLLQNIYRVGDKQGW